MTGCEAGRLGPGRSWKEEEDVMAFPKSFRGWSGAASSWWVGMACLRLLCDDVGRGLAPRRRPAALSRPGPGSLRRAGAGPDERSRPLADDSRTAFQFDEFVPLATCQQEKANRLRIQIPAALRRPSDRQFEQRTHARRIAAVGVLIVVRP